MCEEEEEKGGEETDRSPIFKKQTNKPTLLNVYGANCVGNRYSKFQFPKV